MLASATDAELMVPWTLKTAGKTVFTMPRVAVFRAFIMNHADPSSRTAQRVSEDVRRAARRLSTAPPPTRRTPAFSEYISLIVNAEAQRRGIAISNEKNVSPRLCVPELKRRGIVLRRVRCGARMRRWPAVRRAAA